MNPNEMYEYLERIATLIRTSVRKKGLEMGLQPIQIEALHYLSRCNHYSNTPVAVAEFLGLTKGTVSQTLLVLESAGLVTKEVDQRDRRVIRIRLTTKGDDALDQVIPPSTLKSALSSLQDHEARSISSAVEHLMITLQDGTGFKTFGACKTCVHHLKSRDGLRHCGLTRELLTNTDAEKLCREHQIAA
jgi:DNA-binding MarR family transcriptional regulator